MAKSDFCFTYYDGDAARDMAHMNRLERGCYTDFIISQRKFGHLSLDQIKKILGKDFTDCWGAIELILKIDTEGKFFIEWLENSESKSKKHSKRQSQNAAKRYPKTNLGVPLEDGDGNEDVIENEFKGVQGENFEQKFDRAFDEILIEQYRMNFPSLDIQAELNHFRLKCNSAKSEYHSRDPDGLRLGFLKQLEHSPNKKKNGLAKIIDDKLKSDAIIRAKFASKATAAGASDG